MRERFHCIAVARSGEMWECGGEVVRRGETLGGKNDTEIVCLFLCIVNGMCVCEGVFTVAVVIA